MELDDILRVAVPFIGIAGTLVVTLVGIIIRRLYGSIDLLFKEVGVMRRQINILKLAALQGDPESTALFNALTASGEKE